MNIKHNCKVYTPKKIAEKMIDTLEIDFSSDFMILEPAIGTGNIFVELIKRYALFEENTERLYESLNNRFCGFDIDENDILFCKDRLNQLLTDMGLNSDLVNWNIIKMDILDLNFPSTFKKVTHIICNPPYISYRNLNEEDRRKIKQYKSCKIGTPNLYYAFIEFSILFFPNLISSTFITPSSYLSNKNAFVLRDIIDKNINIKSLLHFEDHVFDAQVIATISHFVKFGVNKTHIYRSDKELTNVLDFYENSFTNNEMKREYIKHIKSNYYTIDDFFKISGSIATLDDNFFVIKRKEIIEKNIYSTTFFKKINANTIKFFLVESDLIKKIASSPKKKSESYIIYPYYDNIPIPIETIINDYPLYYQYLNSYSDKQHSPHYGRNQNLGSINLLRLVVPRSMTKFNFYSVKDCVVNSGYSLIIRDEWMHKMNDIIVKIDEMNEMITNHLRKMGQFNDKLYFAISKESLKSTPIMER